MTVKTPIQNQPNYNVNFLSNCFSGSLFQHVRAINFPLSSKNQIKNNYFLLRPDYRKQKRYNKNFENFSHLEICDVLTIRTPPNFESFKLVLFLS